MPAPTAAAQKLSAQAHTVLEEQKQEAAKEVQEARKTARYFIKAPIADAPEELKKVEPKTVIQIHKGQVVDLETGETISRKPGTVTLVEGIGFTDNPYYAAYIQEQWPDFEVTTVTPEGAAEEFKYREELAELNALVSKSKKGAKK